MTRFFKDAGGAAEGAVLDFIAAAARDGHDAAVPAGCLPCFTVRTRLRPERAGEAAGCYVFPARAAARARRCAPAERLLAAGLLALSAPLLLAVALLVRLFDGRPVLFRQTRFGCGGRPFTLVKFRTMVRRSERLHARLQRRRGQAGRLFKLARDPRVTPLGGVLRRTFLDELPQLVNVARGEMRLVGPRPLPASDEGHYVRDAQRLRLGGMPGMTGLWQVSGRNACSFDEMCLLDVFYLRRASLALDLFVLWRTAGLLWREGALKREAEGRGEEPGGVEQAGACGD